MIFSLLIFHNHDRMSSITRVLHNTTLNYFTFCLPKRFSSSPEVVKEAIMTDIDGLVQEFWRTSSDGTVGASLFAMRRLHDILQRCLEVCFDIKSVDLTDKILQIPVGWHYSTRPDFDDFDDRIEANFKILLDGYRKMIDHSFSKSKDLGDMLRFLRILPGVVVQKPMSIQGMAYLYRIKPDLLKRLFESTIEPLRPLHLGYILDDYLSGFFQDRDRSQLNYCDPMHQHISICRHFFSLLAGSNVIDLQS